MTKRFSVSIISVVGILFLLPGCTINKTELKKVLEENPDIIFEALEKNPAKFAQAMQKASMEGKRLAQEEAEKREKAEREEELKNPKKPEIPADRAVRGDRNAPIVIVEYSDFQCPYCSRGFQTVEELRKKYGKKMLFMYKHLPLPFHPLAMPAAKRFEAIAMQSSEKAYKFHDEVFSKQDQLGSKGEKFLDSVAQKVGADMGKMKKDMESETVKSRLAADNAEAGKFGIQGTPGFIVNGLALKGAYPASSFEEILAKTTK